ncbi:MAG: hypothetical protein OXU31_01510 [Gammaproteobacteria bacterium]|nr:hypothetical protein [Gammaproteobacteria bacterium]
MTADHFSAQSPHAFPLREIEEFHQFQVADGFMGRVGKEKCRNMRRFDGVYHGGLWGVREIVTRRPANVKSCKPAPMRGIV